MGSKGTTRDKNVRGNMVGIFYSRCACLFGSFWFCSLSGNSGKYIRQRYGDYFICLGKAERIVLRRWLNDHWCLWEYICCGLPYLYIFLRSPYSNQEKRELC